VVSRSGLGKVVGVISLQDALHVYGFGAQHRPSAAPPREEFRAPLAKLTVVVAAVAGLLLLAVSLGYIYRSQRAASARRCFQAANDLVANGRFSEAIEPYRHALSIAPSEEYRLALALALVHVQRFDEAGIYLREVLRNHPNSGPANLGQAEVDGASGQIDEAVGYYHRALYGVWPGDPQAQRVETRMELVNELASAGRKKQAQAELLSLRAVMPADPAVRERVAQLLLDFDLPQESADVYRELLQERKNDPGLYAGLGAADAALWKYAPACSAYRHALRIKPDDAAIRQRLDSCEQVLALDPSSTRLSAVERFKRSRALVELVLAARDQCAAAHPQDPKPEAESALAERARKELAVERRPPSYSDAADDNIELAGQLWAARPQSCRPAANPPAPLDKVMAHLAQ
jgi:tetratricopeptide (TPR) repeat protein